MQSVDLEHCSHPEGVVSRGGCVNKSAHNFIGRSYVKKLADSLRVLTQFKSSFVLHLLFNRLWPAANFWTRDIAQWVDGYKPARSATERGTSSRANTSLPADAWDISTTFSYGSQPEYWENRWSARVIAKPGEQYGWLLLIGQVSDVFGFLASLLPHRLLFSKSLLWNVWPCLMKCITS